MNTVLPIHFSVLKLMSKSAAHVLGYKRPDTNSLKKGRHFHRVLLGENGYKIWGAKRQGKPWTEFKAANDGHEIVTLDEHSVAMEMAAATRAHPDVPPLLEGAKEKTIRWKWLGLDCEGTPDVLASTHLTDVKSARDSSPNKFLNHGRWYAYHAQLAFYRLGAASLGLCSPDTPVYIIATESIPPYVPTVFRLTDLALEKGERLCRLWMERLMVCLETGEWPGYASGIVDFDVPDTDSFDIGDEEDAEEVA